MNIVFALLFGAGGAAAGWLFLRIVDRATAGDARRAKRIDTVLVTIVSATVIAALSVKFRSEAFLLLVYAALALVLIGVAVFDLRKHRIPHWVTIPGTIAGLVLSALILPLGVRESVLGVVTGAGVLLIATLVETLRKKEIGGGDWKYAAMIGSFIGPQKIVIALVLTGVFGVLGSIAMALTGNQPRPHALGPWLSAGAVASILLG